LDAVDVVGDLVGTLGDLVGTLGAVVGAVGASFDLGTGIDPGYIAR